jgi:hypothetical protein
MTLQVTLHFFIGVPRGLAGEKIGQFEEPERSLDVFVRKRMTDECFVKTNQHSKP